MNPERNRENNEIQEINQPKQVELTNAEKDEMKRDLEANPPTLDHQGELEQIKGKVDGQDKRQEENKTLANTEDVKNQDDGENKNSKEDAKTNVDAQNDVGDKNMRLERTESKAELDIERVKGHPKDMLVHENGETRELTKEEVDAIDKKVEEVEKERAEQKAATEKEYAEKLKGVEPDSREYYELQKEKADRLEAIDKEYDKKSDEVEILKDLHKQGDKLKEGSEKGKTSDISVDRDELKTATLEEKEAKAEAGPRETKEDTKPEQDNVQETGEKTEKNRENNNVKETSGGENEKPKLDVEHVAGHPKDMLVHENGKTRELTKEEVEAIDKKVEEVEKERAEQKAATEKEYAEKLKGVEPDSREYYALQKEKADKLETIDKEYDKKGDEVEILKDLHKQGDKPKEGSEKGKTSDISVDRDELKTATPEEKGPKAEAGPRETKEDTKPEQGNVQETGEKTEKNRENNNVKETAEGENEKPKLDVEHVAGHPKDMLVHENGKTRELTKEEVEAIDKKVEEVEKERAEQKAATEKEYAEKLKGVEPDSREYYALQKEKADKLETIDKEYDKKGDEVEILKDLHKQGDKPKEGSEKGKTSDINIDKDELKTATPEEKQPNPEAGTRETKEDTKPEQDNIKETGDKTEKNRENNNVKETAEGENEKPKLDVEHVAGHPKDMLVHENGKTRELTKEEVEAIDKKVEEVEKERAEQKAATEKEYAEKLKGVEPDTQEYYALQKEKADRLEAIDKEYDKKADEVEILKEMHKQGDKPEEGQEKGKRSDIAIDKDELRPATPEEKKPEPAAEGKGANKETKGEAKPEQDKTQEAKESTGINQNIKENSGETKETPAYDVERVKGMPYEMGVHENGKLRSLTKEEAEQIGQRIENAEKEYTAKKAEIEAKIEEKYAKELKEAKPGSSEYYDAQRRKHEEKEAQLSALGKEYQKKTDPVEVFYDMKKQEVKSEEGSEKGKRNDVANGKDELRPAAPEKKTSEPAARPEAHKDNGREYSVREIADNNPEMRRALDEVKEEVLKALPGAKDVRIEGDDIAFTMPNGSKLRVSIQDQIIISDTETNKEKVKHGIALGRNVLVEGYKQNRGDYTLIVLSLDSSKGTMYHEAFHFAWESALSDKEKADMSKHFEQEAKKTGASATELMADDYKKWKLEREQRIDTLFGRCYNKISDFYNSAKSILTKTENAHNIYRKISDGDVWNRPVQGKVDDEKGRGKLIAEPEYSIKETKQNENKQEEKLTGNHDVRQNSFEDKKDHQLTNKPSENNYKLADFYEKNYPLTKEVDERIGNIVNYIDKIKTEITKLVEDVLTRVNDKKLELNKQVIFGFVEKFRMQKGVLVFEVNENGFFISDSVSGRNRVPLLDDEKKVKTIKLVFNNIGLDNYIEKGKEITPAEGAINFGNLKNGADDVVEAIEKTITKEKWEECKELMNSDNVDKKVEGILELNDALMERGDAFSINAAETASKSAIYSYCVNAILPNFSITPTNTPVFSMETIDSIVAACSMNPDLDKVFACVTTAAVCYFAVERAYPYMRKKIIGSD